MGNLSDLYNKMNTTPSLKPNNTKKGLEDIVRKSIPENEVSNKTDDKPILTDSVSSISKNEPALRKSMQETPYRETLSGPPIEGDLTRKTSQGSPKEEDRYNKTKSAPAPQLVTADKENLSLYLKLAKNVSSNCLKMYCIIDELCKYDNEWKKITREEFILAGIKGEKITSSRLEGKERGLFDFKEIEHKNEKTGKTNITHVLYRLLK